MQGAAGADGTVSFGVKLLLVGLEANASADKAGEAVVNFAVG
ncbi:MAG: hypothetical protein ABIN01_11985 [Ferruginibacter sp.]